MTRRILLLTLLLLSPVTAAPQEIRVMLSGAFTEAYQQLIPEFEKTTNYKVVTSFGASLGGAPDSIPVRLGRGEPADVLIMTGPALDALTKQGRVAAGTRVDLARSTIGMVVRAGARKPDISTVDALRRTLLEAKSIAYSASASGTYLATELFPKLGIADQIRGKTQRIESERVAAVVARGDAEVGFQQVSELLPVPGVDFVGPLPPGAQQVTIVAAGIATAARERAGARALIDFLASPRSTRAIQKSGLEPLAATAAAGEPRTR